MTMTDHVNHIVLTGDRPTGKLHLGHYIGSLKNRVLLQEEHTQFVMIADLQALTDNAENPEKVRGNVEEVLLDNLAVGVDPRKTTFFIQSQVPALFELTLYFLNLVTLARLKRNPTVKDEMNEKGYGENVPAGFLMYPVSQAADILFCKATLVPVGEDQLPMIEQTNEIVKKFNSLYGETFGEVKGLVPQRARLLGVDGKKKMSKSLGNAIYLSDTEEEVKRKVMQLYTDPVHVRKEDPGKVEGNAVFDYLDIFDSHKEELEEIKSNYAKGGVGDIETKTRLAGILNELLKPLRERRAEYAEDRKKLEEILKEGSNHAQEVGSETLKEVKEKMKINYFE